MKLFSHTILNTTSRAQQSRSRDVNIRSSSAPAFLQMCNKLLIQNNDVAKTVTSSE